MWDKLDIRIPFKPSEVSFLARSTADKPDAYIDFKKYSFPAHAPDVKIVDGLPIIECWKNRDWDSISSGYAGMAVGFFPRGQGYHTYPTVSIKASPAKIIQGHNVFGSESSVVGIDRMLQLLNNAYPDIFNDLDIFNASIRYTDSTYSAPIQPFFSNKIFPLFESLATSRQSKNKNTDYLQLGVNSEYQRQKIYKKLQELIADLQDAKRKRDFRRIDILADKRLHDFAQHLHRFEATTGPRKFESLGIPTNIVEFVKHEKKFLADNGYPLCQFLWHQAFDPLFSQFEGHTMKNVDDHHIKLKIDAKFIKIKDNGKVCKRLANAIFRTYIDIKRDGYSNLCALDNQTFFRNVKYLEQAGISKAFLKSLDPHTTDNVIPFVNILKIDFNNQRPDWYVEPTLDYTPHGSLSSLLGKLRLVS